MKLNVSLITIMVLVLMMATSVFAAQPVTFLKDGRNLTATILDMSSNNGMVEYYGNTKIHRSQIWMINYADNNWNFPDERNQLSRNMDTIILHDGQILHESIADFSSRRRMYEFRSGRKVNESQVRRIYFCCDVLPGPYQNALNEANRRNNQNNNQGYGDGHNRGNNGGYDRGGRNDRGSERYMTIFLSNGRSISNPLKYLNDRKTGFMDGLQINTHDIWMINLEGNRWNYDDERRDLDPRVDSIFLKDGKVIYDVVVEFTMERGGMFYLERNRPIHESQISRIYFCCESLPEAYRHKGFDRRR